MRAPSRWVRSFLAVAMAGGVVTAAAGPARAQTCHDTSENFSDLLYLSVCFDETTPAVDVYTRVFVGAETIAAFQVRLQPAYEEVFVAFLDKDHTYLYVSRRTDPETGGKTLDICVKTTIRTEPVERCSAVPLP